MRQIVFVCFLMCFSIFAKAQYVDIPDTAFRRYLKDFFPTCFNANDQMDTTCDGVLQLTSFGLPEYYENGVNSYGYKVRDVTGIIYFKSVKRLTASRYSYVSALYDLPDSLEELEFAESGVDSIYRLPNRVKKIKIFSSYLSYIGNFPDSLIDAYLSGDNLKTVPPLPPLLKSLVLEGNDLDTLPALNESLEILGVALNYRLTKLPSLPLKLKRLSIDYTNFSSVPELPNSLNSLGISYTKFTAMPTLPNSLEDLSCDGTAIEHIASLPDSLKRLFCTAMPNLHCFPKLPKGLTDLYYDTSIIHCIPNPVPAYPDLPVCNSTNNPNSCPVYNACIWTGAINNAWEEAGNWNCGHMPDSTTDVIINSGTITINSNVVINSLTLNPSASLTITTGHNITVKH